MYVQYRETDIIPNVKISIKHSAILDEKEVTDCSRRFMRVLHE